jgi:hypothetical protein
MSTDILKFSNDEQDLQLGGRKLYLVIALPMTALTFLAWYVIFWLAKRTSLPPGAGNEDFSNPNAV